MTGDKFLTFARGINSHDIMHSMAFYASYFESNIIRLRVKIFRRHDYESYARCPVCEDMYQLLDNFVHCEKCNTLVNLDNIKKVKFKCRLSPGSHYRCPDIFLSLIEA